MINLLNRISASRANKLQEREQNTLEQWQAFGITITDKGGNPNALYNFSIEVESASLTDAKAQQFTDAIEDAKEVLDGFYFANPITAILP